MRILPWCLALPGLMFIACGQPNMTDNSSSGAKSYTEAADSTQLATDITPVNSPSRKRVRTAHIRARVDNVVNAVISLEHAVTGIHGIITESVMTNQAGTTEDQPYTRDSLKRVMVYTPSATLTLRVPAASLDSIVNVLTKMAAFIDQRTLNDEDKTLGYLSNALRNKAQEASATAIPARKGTPLDVVAYKDARTQAEIDRQIANLAILDDVNYATFTVELFQPQQADVQVVVNPARITRPGFWTEVKDSLYSGADFFRNFFLILLHLWPFILSGAGIWIGYKKWVSKKVAVVK